MDWKNLKKLHRFEGETMGTRYQVSYRGADSLDHPGLQISVHAAIRAVDDGMSNWQPNSPLSQFNRAPVAEWFPVPYELAYVVSEALAVSQRSSGAFDVTVGGLVNAWGFGPRLGSHGGGDHPTPAEIDTALAHCGHRYLESRLDSPALRKSKPVELDLCGIAKGFGVDEMVDVLEDAGVTDYLVAVDGEVHLSGSKGEHEPWQIALETPLIGKREIWDILAPPRTAIATSGDYRHVRSWDGRNISHTIDPRTGYPVTHALASVTVAAASCLLADAWAGALMVLGADAGVALAEANGLTALFLVRDGDRFTEITTGDFAALIG